MGVRQGNPPSYVCVSDGGDSAPADQTGAAPPLLDPAPPRFAVTGPGTTTLPPAADNPAIVSDSTRHPSGSSSRSSFLPGALSRGAEDGVPMSIDTDLSRQHAQELSNAMTRLHRDHVGRGPNS